MKGIWPMFLHVVVYFPAASLSLPTITMSLSLSLLRWIQDEGSGGGEVHERGRKQGERTQPGELGERHAHIHSNTNPSTDSPSSTHRLRPFSLTVYQLRRTGLVFVSRGSSIRQPHTCTLIVFLPRVQKHTKRRLTRRYKQHVGVCGMWALITWLVWLPSAKPAMLDGGKKSCIVTEEVIFFVSLNLPK